MSYSLQEWQLNKWLEDSRKTAKQIHAEIETQAAQRKAALDAADERFLTMFPHLRPTEQRLAALRDGKCAHCSARYPDWEHVAHFYCSSLCAEAAAAVAVDATAAK